MTSRTKKLTKAQHALLLQFYRRGDIDGGDSRAMLDKLVEQGMLGKTVMRYRYRWFLTEKGRAYCQQLADPAVCPGCRAELTEDDPCN